MPELESSEADELPDDSAALRLVEMMWEAHISTLPKAEAMRLLAAAAAIAEQRADKRVVQIRRTSRQQKREAAERAALAAFREMLEVWMARLRT